MVRKSLVVVALACLALAQPVQDARMRAQALVKEAAAFGRKHGKDVLIREINQGSGRFHVRTGEELYVFMYDLQGNCQAIGFQSQMVGMNRFNVKDPDGKYFLQEMLQVARTKGSGWVDYKYPNPRNGRVEAKTSYVELLDGSLIGCGVYR